MGRKWTNAEQEQFLLARNTKYRVAGEKKQYTAFWDELSGEWFAEFGEDSVPGGLEGIDPSLWPEAERDAAQARIIARKQQLKDWYRNHNRVECRVEPAGFLDKLLKIKTAKKAGGRRHKKPVEVFSTRFYQGSESQKTVNRLVREEAPCTDDGEPIKETLEEIASRRMKIYTTTIDAAWAVASDEQKKVVEEVMEEQAAKGLCEEDMEDDIAVNMEDKLKHLPRLVNLAIRELHESSGWYFTILAGGRNVDGKVQVASYHLGETTNGNDFSEAYSNYKTAVMRPWTVFVRNLVGEDQNLPARVATTSTNPEPSDSTSTRTSTLFQGLPELPDHRRSVQGSRCTIALGPSQACPPQQENTCTTALQPANEGAPSEGTSHQVNGGTPSDDPATQGVPPTDDGTSADDPNNQGAPPVNEGTPQEGANNQGVPPANEGAPSEGTSHRVNGGTPSDDPDVQGVPPTDDRTLADDPNNQGAPPVNEGTPPDDPDAQGVPPTNNRTPEDEPDIPNNQDAPPVNTGTPSPSGVGVVQPGWFATALNHMRTVQSQDWLSAVELWASIECGANFGGKKPRRFGTESRPSQLSRWFSYGRVFTSDPPISDLSEYEADVRRWWVFLQPTWRASGDPLPLPIYCPPAGSDWGGLKSSGPNGLLLIMMLFTWWGRALHQSPSSPSWLAATADLRKALQSMSETEGGSSVPRPSRKRARVAAKENLGNSTHRKKRAPPPPLPPRTTRSTGVTARRSQRK